MMRLAIPTLLLLSGAMLIYVGAGTLFFPHAFFESNGASLGEEPSLMSEVRAPGGMLIASGFVVALGALRKALAGTALALSALLYGTFGVSRVISIVLDGVPSGALVSAMALELVICVMASLALTRTRRSPE